MFPRFKKFPDLLLSYCRIESISLVLGEHNKTILIQNSKPGYAIEKFLENILLKLPLNLLEGNATSSQRRTISIIGAIYLAVEIPLHPEIQPTNAPTNGII